jgi:prophage DNA circulation protein
MTTDRHAEAGGGSAAPDDPEQLRQEIERTREQLGETVEALVAKTDVKARAKERAGQLSQVLKDKTAQAKEQTTAAVAQAKEQTTARVGQARGQLAGKTSDAKTVTQPVQRAAQHVRQRAATPAGGLVAAAVAGAAVLGFIVIRRRRRR